MTHTAHSDAAPISPAAMCFGVCSNPLALEAMRPGIVGVSPSTVRGTLRTVADRTAGIQGGPPTMADFEKRERDRRHDAQRREAKPWRAWYASTEWRAKRAEQLRRFPTCAVAHCGQRATIVDHVVRHGGDFVRFWNGRLQSLCKPHHDGLKQSLERGDRAACGPDGLPLDPSHPWSG